MLSEKEKRSIIYSVSVDLLYWFTLIIVFTVFLLFLKKPVSAMNFIIPSIAIALYVILSSKHADNRLIEMVVLIIITGSILVISGMSFDHTWDGAAYHKTAVGFLKEGWNPIYQSLQSYKEETGIIKWDCPNPVLWAEVYPKATWYFAASVYALTGDIEVGKAYTLVGVVVLFGIVYNYISYKNIKKWQICIVALVAGLNPIVFCQVQTYYLDGFVSCILMSMMIIFFSILDEDCDVLFRDRILQLICLILIGCNLKWSVTLYVVTYCACFAIMYLLREKKIELQQLIEVGGLVLSGCCGIFILGFSPFVTNYFRYGNLFEGFISDSVNLVGEKNMANTFGIEGLSNAQMFLSSLFGKMSHGVYHTLGELLKIPFTFSEEELKWYSIPDTRIGGFGIFFSGIFLLSIIVIIYIFMSKEVRKIWVVKSISVFYIVTIVEMLILPATFTARYTCQLYLIPVTALALLFMSIKHKPGIFNRLIAVFLCVFIIGNLWPWLKCCYNNCIIANQTKPVLRQLSEQKDLKLAFYAYDFSGMHFNMNDYGIRDYEFLQWNELEDSVGVTYGNWIRYIYK